MTPLGYAVLVIGAVVCLYGQVRFLVTIAGDAEWIAERLRMEVALGQLSRTGVNAGSVF